MTRQYKVWLEIELVDEDADHYETLDAPGTSIANFTTYDQAYSFVEHAHWILEAIDRSNIMADSSVRCIQPAVTRQSTLDYISFAVQQVQEVSDYLKDQGEHELGKLAAWDRLLHLPQPIPRHVIEHCYEQAGYIVEHMCAEAADWKASIEEEDYGLAEQGGTDDVV